jgi:PAS domain S-box-containing protein
MQFESLKFNSLKFKIILAISLTYLIVAISSGVIFLKTESDYRIKRLDEIRILLDAVFQQNRTNLANEIFTKNTEALLHSIDEIKKVKHIYHIYAYDNEGNGLVPSGNNTEDSLSSTERQNLIKNFAFDEIVQENIPFAVYANAVKYLGECPGYIKIFYNMKDFKKELLINKIIFIVQLSIIFLLFFGILSVLLDRSIIRPASVLRDTINRVSKGNLGEQVDIISNDEIGQIAVDFNAMSVTLFKQHNELVRSSAMVRLIIDNIPQLIFWQDKESRFLGCNKNFVHAIDIDDPDEIIGKTSCDLPVTQIMPDAFNDIIQKVISESKPELHKIEELTLNGEKRYLDANFIPLHNIKGEVESIICSYEDITERITAQKEKERQKRVRERRDQLKRLSEYFMTNQERTQSLMARELHDQLGQNLTALHLETVGLSNFLKKDNPEISKRISTMRFLIEKLIDDVRDISLKLRPDILDRLGLTDALEWYLSDFSKKTDIKTVFKHDSIFRISDTVATAAYRIVQGALSNVMRHASATQVNVTISTKAKTMRLVIGDNGCGFNVSDVSGKNIKGLGVMIMKERAKLAFASLTIQSQINKGTKIIVDFENIFKNRETEDD